MAEERDELDDLLAEFQSLIGGGEGGVEQPEIIGGFFGGTQNLGGPGGIPYAPGKAPTVYRGDAYVGLVKAMSTEELAQFQDAIVANGIVRDVIPGFRDDSTLGAMNELMGLANRSGVTWQSVLDQIGQAGGLKGRTSTPKVQSYQPPDYATLAQTVKETTRKKLGRDPTQAELALMSDELLGIDRLSYNAQKQQTLDNAAGREVSVPSVDVGARFSESFESRFQGQLQQAATEDTVRQVAGETQQQLGAF